MQQEKEILLNIMFAGDYLDDNIGHEIINLFKADDGKSYIYVLPYGTVAKYHEDKIETILLVRRINSKTLEVMCKATDVEIVQDCKCPGVKYNGVQLKDVFKFNTGQPDVEAIFATFVASKVRKVKNTIYITTDVKLQGANYIYIGDINFGKQTLKRYISSVANETVYKTINDMIINNRSIWGEETQKVVLSDATVEDETEKDDFIKILGQQYDELSYSNLFKYIFSKNRKGFCVFAKEILGIDDFSEKYSVQREKKHIDLLIEDEKNVIVIENKIKSGINDEQLSDYYDVAEEIARRKSLDAHYFVFAPNYNCINITLEKYDKGDKYTLVNYSRLYDFFMKNKELYQEIPYFDEFVSALKIHIKAIDNDAEEEMYKRFKKAVDREKRK